MHIRFWGVRGSIASPGPETAEVGGNTSCVEVTCGRQRIILDAGTGLRGLGNQMLRDGSLDATILLSHYHWDHIQGLPFFVPVYMKDAKLDILGAPNGVMGIEEALVHQMSAPVFPVRWGEAGARIGTRDVKPGDVCEVGDVTVKVARGHHPGGVAAYRVEYEGRSVVYATDTEHFACVDPALHALAEGADVLIYDAQYSPEEYQRKVGWGHSTYVAGAELARAAGVGQLVLFHHDPTRTDAGVLAFETSARKLFAGTVAAREGLEIAVDAEVPSRRSPRAA